MVGETQMIHHNGKTTSPPVAVARDMSQVAHDVVELAELHAALVKIEVQQWGQKLFFPAALLIVAAILGCSCVPVLLLSGAYALAQATALSLAWSLLIVGGAGVLLAGLTAWIGWRGFKKAISPFD
jgi:hypothetical protein